MDSLHSAIARLEQGRDVIRVAAEHLRTGELNFLARDDRLRARPHPAVVAFAPHDFTKRRSAFHLARRRVEPDELGTRKPDLEVDMWSRFVIRTAEIDCRFVGVGTE